MHRPIVVMGTVQCGYSLVARILAAHGVWTGVVTDSSSRLGTYCENLEIKRWVQQNVDGDRPLMRECPPHPEFRPFVLSVLERQGYRGGPWLVKQATVYWRLWEEFSPRFILPRRSVGAVVDSVVNAGLTSSWTSIGELRRAVRSMDRRVQYLHQSRGGMFIDMGDLTSGNLQYLGEILKYLGLEMDEDLVREMIRPDEWSYE